jgi:hypothetical protein
VLHTYECRRPALVYKQSGGPDQDRRTTTTSTITERRGNCENVPMVALPVAVVQAVADLLCGRVDELRQAEKRGYSRGVEDTLAAVRRRAEEQYVEPLDVDPPGDWPVVQLGPLPPVDPDLDRRRWPPHGRKRFAEPRPGDFLGRGEVT